MDKSLLTKLASYAEEDYLPMHMPGHKRCDGFPYPAPLPFKFDITEIDGFDDLNHPEGISSIVSVLQRPFGAATSAFTP